MRVRGRRDDRPQPPRLPESVLATCALWMATGHHRRPVRPSRTRATAAILSFRCRTTRKSRTVWGGPRPCPTTIESSSAGTWRAPRVRRFRRTLLSGGRLTVAAPQSEGRLGWPSMGRASPARRSCVGEPSPVARSTPSTGSGPRPISRPPSSPLRYAAANRSGRSSYHILNCIHPRCPRAGCGTTLGAMASRVGECSACRHLVP